MNFTEVLISPILSEKSVIVKDTQNRYTFRVNPKANKSEIKKAVETLFKVKVSAVRTANMPGKLHKVGRHEGYRSDWKKAVVSVKAGQKIDMTDLPK
ncbi:MAG: 50S ribosomal protein L23 [Elusimicrobia bacterium GWA2_61_42]|nr:MAG: 50S ribosomal protein L23 [Elusimicrobia bacterium GWA2_61_42]OGR76866.1 MAG: 50S ribosomal protein L23 [Elusimicrobia bacterium GWC2_61_25]